MCYYIVSLLCKVVLSLIALYVVRRRIKMKRVYELADKLKNSYKPLPLIGHAYMALGTNEDRLNVLKQFSSEAINNKHGVTGAWIGMNFYVVVADPLAAEVLTKAVLVKSDMKAFRHLTGKYGSIFAPLDIWRRHRRVVLHSFSEKHLRDYIEIFANRSLTAVEELDVVADNGPFSIWDRILEYSMTSVSQSLLGMENIDIKDKEHELFMQAFSMYLQYTAEKMSQPWLRSDVIFRIMPIYKKLEKWKNVIHSFIEQVIRKNMSKPAGSPKNVMETIMETSRSFEQPFSLEELRDELVVLILASIDTSTVAVCFTCLMMAMHPECQERAYKEVMEVMKDATAPTIDHLSKLTYLDAVIRETLRLYPPVPLIARKVDEDVELPTGLTIVPNCELLISVWAIHRHPRHWGSDADIFNPDRFLKPSERPGGSFMAFGYGPRNCIGYRLAMKSTKIVLSSIIRRFRILPPSNQSQFELKLKYDVMLKDVNNFQIQLQRRK
ncbi:probable cytochrome P450 313a4 isoform X3 [Aricia agestis]|nr:probable cytochrome P450 313a4 isoform X3 [Aricia agestis]